MLIQKKQVIIYGALFLVILIISGGWWVFQSKKDSTSKELGYQALKINGEYVSPAIFREEHNKFFRRWSRNADMIRKTDEERNDLVLEEIINRIAIEKYLLEESNEQAGPEEVTDYINRYIKTKYSTQTEMQSYLDSVFCATEDDLNRMIKIYLLKVKYFSKLAKENGFTVKAEDVEKEFQLQKKENIKAVFKHIQISIQKHPPKEALKLANQIYEELKNGAEFEEMARKYSDDPETKDKGGELEPATQEEVPPEFAKLIFNSKPGQILQPMDTEFGYEIVKFVKLINYYHSPEEIEATMLMEEFGKSAKFNEWLATVKTKLEIEVIEPSLKAYRLYKDQKYSQAAPIYEKVYQNDGVELNFRKAVQCYRLAKDWDQMLKLCRYGMKRFTDKIPYYLDAAEALSNKGQETEALKLLKEAESMAAGNSYLLDLVTNAYSRLGLKK